MNLQTIIKQGFDRLAPTYCFHCQCDATVSGSWFDVNIDGEGYRTLCEGCYDLLEKNEAN